MTQYYVIFEFDRSYMTDVMHFVDHGSFAKLILGLSIRDILESCKDAICKAGSVFRMIEYEFGKAMINIGGVEHVLDKRDYEKIET